MAKEHAFGKALGDLDRLPKPANSRDILSQKHWHLHSVFSPQVFSLLRASVVIVPVVPAAHYCCGGIKVNLNGESSIRRLYALGEASSTGLHGGNRLASNSMMEAAVYADAAARHAISVIDSIELQRDIPAWDYEGTAVPEEMALITQDYKEMQQIMTNYVGIVRSDVRLERAKRRLEIIFKETEELYLKSTLSQHLCELRNMIAVGYLIIKQAEARHESVGLHYSIDYPAKPVEI